MAAFAIQLAAWEALDKKDRGKKPEEPAEVRLATDDFTPEVLCDLLQVRGKVLLRSDELATVLGAYERYQKPGAINAGRAHMLALYDGGPRRIDRVIRGKMFVKTGRLSRLAISSPRRSGSSSLACPTTGSSSGS